VLEVRVMNSRYACKSANLISGSSNGYTKIKLGMRTWFADVNPSTHSNKSA
jgi:hypothetical protein